MFSRFLLAGEHTLVKSMSHSKVGQLSAFTQKRATCVGCKALLPKDRESKFHSFSTQSFIYMFVFYSLLS